MNKKTVLAVAVIFLAMTVLGASQAYAKEYKIGYVDLAKVFDEYGETKDAERKLEDKGKAKEAERKKMVDAIRKLKDEQALLSEKGKQDKQAAIDEKIKVLQDFDGKAREELLKERNELLGGILKNIEKVIADYSKQNGYDLILNQRTLLYAGEQYDLTAEVLKRLNVKGK
ncbi:MAG: OmpH family outer membrane protein [Candidatus Omnitrophica bacterium]|nr:OmpH family outer membrane protein [Candidatus Omnitrophota bacterium]